jgi:hypothetical protein
VTLPALSAPAVHDLELRAYQSPAAVFRQRADQLRLAHRDRDAAVRPRLREQVQARHDGAGAAVDDHGGLLGPERWVAAVHEVPLPGRHERARRLAVLGAQHAADERRHRLGVGGRGAPEHEAAAQVPDHRRLLRVGVDAEDSRGAKN